MKIIKDEKNRPCLVIGQVEHTLDRATALRLAEELIDSVGEVSSCELFNRAIPTCVNCGGFNVGTCNCY